MTATPLSPPPTDAVSATIKMEQLEVFDASSPRESVTSIVDASSTPAPSTSNPDAKSVKKRKSWGQVLPEPKTSLPPRKRAKTEDEKEQRRIERVKRNRLAAHNSRERKRQEYEVLQDQKDQMELEVKRCQLQLAQLRAELMFYRQKYPGETPPTVFDLSTPTTVTATATTTSTTTADDLATVCPAQTSTQLTSPMSMSMDSFDSPREDSYQPETPPSNFETSPDFDSTQYSAVSVDFGRGLALPGGDCGLPYALPPHATVDEKPVVMDDLFTFDAFPEGATTATAGSMESTLGLADPSVDFFGSALHGHDSISTSYGFADGFDAKFSDLQSASGATLVSDGALAAEF